MHFSTEIACVYAIKIACLLQVIMLIHSLILLTTYLLPLTSTPDDPYYFLVEKHHHIVPHLIGLAADEVLQSHKVPPSEIVNPNGAVLIHLDSHSDADLPYRINDTFFDKLPSKRDMGDLLQYAEINNFLLMLGYMGIVEHIIFVEPPWSNLLLSSHFVTSTFFVASDKTTSQLFTSIVTPGGQDAYDDLLRLFRNPQKSVFHFEEFTARFNKYRAIRFTVIPYKAATDSLIHLLEKEDRDKDIILDVDLDAFGTTSPGAEMMRYYWGTTSYDDMMRFYHTAHDFCDFDAKYWNDLKNGTKASCRKNLSLVHGPLLRSNLSIFQVSEEIQSLVNAIENLNDPLLFHSRNGTMHSDTRHALSQMLEYFVQNISKKCEDDDLWRFLIQPFHVDENTVGPIIEYWSSVLKSVFQQINRNPTAVTAVRSPLYTPFHLLDSIECKALGAFVDVFGFGAGIHYSEEVDPNRVGCEHLFPGHLHHDVGGSMEASMESIPVELKFSNPTQSDMTVEIRWLDHAEYIVLGVLAPGESLEQFTFHGHRFALHYKSIDSNQSESVEEIAVNADAGPTQHITLFKAEL